MNRSGRAKPFLARFLFEKVKSVPQSVEIFLSFCILVSKGVESMPERDALAKRIKAYRRAQHMTQFDFSGATGLSVEEISLIERVGTDPKLSTLQNLSAYMGITVSELLQITDN